MGSGHVRVVGANDNGRHLTALTKVETAALEQASAGQAAESTAEVDGGCEGGAGSCAELEAVHNGAG